MNLLWRGLVKYMNEVKAKYLFGCSSVKTMDPVEVSLVVEKFRGEGQLLTSIEARPLPMYEMARLSVLTSESVETVSKTVDEMIPALLHSYLKAGAKVAASPALDRDFKCVDFFTVLDMESLTQLYERRYRPD
jgi:putative hemolysin